MQLKQLGLPPAVYATIHGPASLLAAVLLPTASHSLFEKLWRGQDQLNLLFLPLYASFVLRALQGTLIVLGNYYYKSQYFWMRIDTGCSYYIGLDVQDMSLLHIYIIYNDVLCFAEILFMDRFRQYVLESMVFNAAEFFVACDSLSRDSELPLDFMLRQNSPLKTFRKWFSAIFQRRRTGEITLPEGDETLGLLHNSSVVPTEPHSPIPVPPALAQIAQHWLTASGTNHRALWITTSTLAAYDSIAREVSAVLPCGTAIVDVSQARAVFWPLVQGLICASTSYREELGINPPSQFRHFFPLFSFYMSTFASYEPYRAPWPNSEDTSYLLGDIICEPLLQRHERLKRPFNRATLIIRGLTSIEQVQELYYTISTLDHMLGDLCAVINIVVLGPPHFLQIVSDPHRHMMAHLSTLYISESGLTVYSEQLPPPPPLAENLYLLLVNVIQWTGGFDAERAWLKAQDIARVSRDTVVPDLDVSFENITDPSLMVTTEQILACLQGAYRDRKAIFEALRELPGIPMAYHLTNLAKDNAKIARYLEYVFHIDIASMSEEAGQAVLNLLHDVLNTDFLENDSIPSPEIFNRKAQALLNALTLQLERLPEHLTVTGVVLSNEHPLKHGGFSEIYHGKWMLGTTGEYDVALKVLKTFRNNNHNSTAGIPQQLFREALVWRYLRHPNIAPFIGVDSVTFESPALVSPWCAQGSLLKYISRHAPVADYALEMRNILIEDEGRPCLTDFGLTRLVGDADAFSQKDAEKPSGSTRWMAPELFKPPFRSSTASDVWAFACVCCEIWTEGQHPWNFVDPDTGVIATLADLNDSDLLGEPTLSEFDALEPSLAESSSPTPMGPKRPYLAQPFDSQGSSMSNSLWELVLWCWSIPSADRPTVSVVVGVLSQIRKAERNVRRRTRPETGNPFVVS
ncbi:Serine/threonine-protein kinase STY8 [Favolaschia claudopus]|uniref:Serine/threonine-protein kinase STY8 n=1 Tax=Favolaschia claudopus TaxID=2862362 RepID=A0AAW0CYP8_9AGAR